MPAVIQNDVPMRGKGVYGMNSGQQHSAMLNALPLISNSVAESWGKRSYADRPFTIVEYGCSDGKNSVEPVAAALRPLLHAKCVQIFLNDRPENDFAATSKNVEKIEENGEKDGIRAFTAMVPKNFYKQVLPPNSADVGFSLMSVHYVNTLPPLRAGEGALDASRRETKQEIWEKDFCSFLVLRASELVPGSSLVLSFLSNPPEGETNFEVVNESLRWAQQEMIREDILSQDFIRQFELPTHYPSPERVREKVTSVGDWEIKDLFQQEIKHPAVQELKERRAKRDDAKDLEWYANTVIDWFMAVISGYFLKTLLITHGEKLDEEQRERVLEDWKVRSKKRFLAEHKDAKHTAVPENVLVV
ncbi:S-adenosyl-L-methionine-dependent methyltransferase [Phyllosticta citribraziliensis]